MASTELMCVEDLQPGDLVLVNGEACEVDTVWYRDSDGTRCVVRFAGGRTVDADAECVVEVLVCEQGAPAHPAMRLTEHRTGGVE